MAIIIAGLIMAGILFKQARKPVSLSQYIRGEEVEFFLEINLENNDWQNYINNNTEAEVFFKNFLFKNDWPESLWQRKEIEIKKIALALVGTEDKINKIWLVQTNNNINDLSLYLSGYYFSILDQETGIFSLSKEPIDRIKFNRETNLWFGYGENFFVSDAPSFIQIRLSEEFVNREDRDWLELESTKSFAKNYFNWQSGSFVYLRANIENNKIVFEMDVPISEVALSETEEVDENKFLSLNETIEIKQIKLSDVLNIMKSEINKEGNMNWDLMQNYLQDKYKLNIEALNTFFKQPISLWLKPKRDLAGAEEFLNLDNYYYALMIEKSFDLADETIFVSLENFVKNYFAFKYPVERKKVLLDGTAGIERVANTSRFDFLVIERKEGMRMKLAKGNGFEFVYYVDDNKLILSDRQEFLDEVLSGWENLAGKNEFSLHDYVLEFDSKMLGGEYWQLGERIRLKSEFKKDGLLIKGIFLN